MEALKYLDRYDFSDDANQEEPHFWGLIPTPEELAAKRSEENPPLPQGGCWGEGECHPTANPSGHNAATSTRHSAEHVSLEARSDNQAEQDRKSPPSISIPLDDKPDYYIEPPSPEVQAAFDHEMRIETGGYPEGEIPDEPPPPPPSRLRDIRGRSQANKRSRRSRRRPSPVQPAGRQIQAPTIRGP